MAKKNVLKTLAGLAVAGAAVGGAVAYVKKCKDVNRMGEDDFDDLDDLMEDSKDCECSTATERTYMTLPKDGSETGEEDEKEFANDTEDKSTDTEDKSTDAEDVPSEHTEA